MPSSYPENICPIIHLVAKLRPRSIFDIGVGRGKYGFLVREYFPGDRMGDWEPVTRLDGLEIFPGYITDIHRLIYDEVHIGNALEFSFPETDLFLLIDVIEHMSEEDGHRLLEKLTKLGKVLVSTPTNIGCQGAVYGNEHETHIFQWLPKHFNEKYQVIEDWSNDSSFIYVLNKV